MKTKQKCIKEEKNCREDARGKKSPSPASTDEINNRSETHMIFEYRPLFFLEAQTRCLEKGRDVNMFNALESLEKNVHAMTRSLSLSDASPVRREHRNRRGSFGAEH
jgi:hypothetical protein